MTMVFFLDREKSYGIGSHERGIPKEGSKLMQDMRNEVFGGGECTKVKR